MPLSFSGNSRRSRKCDCRALSGVELDCKLEKGRLRSEFGDEPEILADESDEFNWTDATLSSPLSPRAGSTLVHTQALCCFERHPP